MYFRFAIAAILALSGLTNPASEARETLAPELQAEATSVATEAVADASAAPDGVTVEEHDLLVPAVGPTGEVVATRAVTAARAAGDVIVTEQVVTADRIESEVIETGDFQTLGVTWPDDAGVGDVGARVRTRADGAWSTWVPLEPADGAPDPGSADAARMRGGTDPLWVGAADAVQLSFAATAQGGPDGMSLALVDAAVTAASDAVVGRSPEGKPSIQTAGYAVGTLAMAGPPRVISRAEWGARDPACTPDVARSGLVGAVVHHTAGSNNYQNVAEAMSQIRGDQAYHIDARGWCDIGYNFLVDKWGNIYEGRANSLTQAVIGVHASGFNTGTVGVSMLGTYGALPPMATLQAVAQVIGWRLGAYGLDPRGSTAYPVDGGVRPRVIGHREVASTACPGEGGLAGLPAIRGMAWDASYADRYTQARPVVKAMYRDLLLRDVDANGLNTWSAMLASGAGQPALVGSLTSSREYIRLRITKAYEEVLGRSPEATGLAEWIRAVEAGELTVDIIKRRFYDSQEYYNRSGGSPEVFIDLLYRSAFQRPASAAESAEWSARIPSAGRPQVVDGIYFSMEAALYRAGGYYQVFLKRSPDRAGQEGWARVLLASGEGAVRIGIAGSEEYRQLATGRFPT